MGVEQENDMQKGMSAGTDTHKDFNIRVVGEGTVLGAGEAGERREQAKKTLGVTGMRTLPGSLG